MDGCHRPIKAAGMVIVNWVWTCSKTLLQNVAFRRDPETVY